MIMSLKNNPHEFSESNVVMTYPAGAWYVARDEEFSLLGPFPAWPWGDTS